MLQTHATLVVTWNYQEFIHAFKRLPNQQSWVAYISSYRPPNQISTVHCEEHVIDHLSKFHLTLMVNKSGNVILRKLRKPKQTVAPSA